MPVLRFFRGVMGSHGVWDEGRGEIDDALARLGCVNSTQRREFIWLDFHLVPMSPRMLPLGQTWLD